MTSFKTLNNIAGWLVFAIAAVVLCAAAQPTGSLWDCGEFISGAYKLQVVHPPGAPVFLLVGRLFTWVASLLSSDPSAIAYSVNVLSALSSAFAAMFICWSTTYLSRLAIADRNTELSSSQSIAVVGSGVVAGLTTAFITSVWFSAVEGEVYAMSTFFTCMTLWATLKWYHLPDTSEADRWLIFAFFSTALSIGVHLLSLLTFPALAMFYYFKKAKKTTVTGALLAALVGVLFIVAIQKIIISGIPAMWASFDRIMVNSFGMPFFTGIIPVALIFGAAIWLGLRYAHKNNNGTLQRIIVALGVTLIAYMVYGTVVVRAQANPPINMNDPSDPMRVMPYLNREQYGERPLLRGPNFDVRVPEDVEEVTRENRYGRVGDHYEVVEEKIDYVYKPSSQVLFPRMGDYSQDRPRLYRRWIDKPSGSPTFADNLEFFWKYQLGWMYWRYFMWNFVGRQNGEQGTFAADPTQGNWISGFDFYDERRIGNLDELPDFARNNQARNTYYFIPFLLGLLGLFFHFMRRPKDFSAVLSLFIITGIGIIVYSNQPPSEPRERDYVLVGSFFTFAIWVGMSVMALHDLFSSRLRLPGAAASVAATALALTAPLLLVTQNWDDHSRAKQYASRDYAKNFLESCQPNAIIFTYGDNDTYPLWYCQEVENIRTDIRVVNLSLIATDWYINQMRRAVNNSPAIKMSITPDKIRGKMRMQIPLDPRPAAANKEVSLADALKFLSEDHPPVFLQSGEDFETYLPARKFFMSVDKAAVAKYNVMAGMDSSAVISDTIRFELDKKTSYILRDQLAIMDIIASNLWERPIYWAVTCQRDRLMGMEDFLQLEGLSLRVVPVRTKSSLQNYGIIGSGRVNTDIAYDNIMNKWAWGNFDKERQFVDRSFLPSLQTMRISMIRIARQMVVENKKEQAVAFADKYFEAFPAFNFKYDEFSAFMADIYARAGANDKAALKIRDIANVVEQDMRYYNSQPPNFEAAFTQDMQQAIGVVQILMNLAEDMKDVQLQQDLDKQFARYLPQTPPLPGMQDAIR